MPDKLELNSDRITDMVSDISVRKATEFGIQLNTGNKKAGYPNLNRSKSNGKCSGQLCSHLTTAPSRGLKSRILPTKNPV